ncbi:MAG: 2-hydroxyacid dehydrogenase [Actinomycetes bacterium]
MTLVCIPWSEPEVVASVIPAGVAWVTYDGTGEVPRSDEVDFFVPPYMGADHTLQVMEHMSSLKAVQTLTAGVDNVWAHLPSGVTLCNAKGVHDASTAELAVGLTIASLRKFPEFVRAQETGDWLYGRYDALADKTVLIVGFGSVGEALEQRLIPFEVTIVKVARTARAGVSGFESLAQLLPHADVVILTAPLTEQTRGLVNGGFIESMKPGALLVNVARGPVVNTEDLLAAVKTGRIKAALDVTDPEPLPADHELWRTPGVLISPHVGGNTTAFLPRAYRLVHAQLLRYVADEPLHNIMTAP